MAPVIKLLFTAVAAGIAAVMLATIPCASAEPATPPSKPFAWTVKAPPLRLVLLFDRQTALAVSTGEIGATNVRIALSTLQDATTGAQLGPEYLQLCLPSATICGSSINIGPRKTEGLLLQVAPTFRLNGTFAGSISLAVDQKVEMDSFDLSILSTSRFDQILGATLILAGIVVSWFVSVFIRQRTMRTEALGPAAELGDSLRKFIVEVEQAHKKSENHLPKTLDRLRTLLDSLAPERLEAKGFLPRSIPNPFKGSADPADAYKQFLTNLSNEVITLSVVIRKGIKNVITKLNESNNREAITAALQKLDVLAEEVSSADEAEDSIKKIRAELEDVLAGGGVRGMQASGGAPVVPIPLPSLQQLHIQLSRLSLSVWFIWGGLTWLVGVIALVATNYGFGIGLDYFKCFLWGLGVQVAGNQLQQLVPTTVSTTFGISFPKA